MNVPPFSPDIVNKPFVYLRKTLTQEYDLFVAIPLAAGQKVIYTNKKKEALGTPQVYYSAGMVIAGFEVKETGDTTNMPARVETFVFRKIVPPQVTPPAPQLIGILGMQYLEFDDADPNSEKYGDIAENCPYLNFEGMMQGIANTAAPKVIVPVVQKTIQQNLDQIPKDISANNAMEMLSKVELTDTNLTGVHWEMAENLTTYVVPASNVSGGFEVQLSATGNPPVRKTKVKNKNKTSTGGGGSWIKRVLYRVITGFLRLFR